MISWDVSTRVKASLAVGVVAACAVSGVGLAASGSTPAPATAPAAGAQTAPGADPTMYDGTFPVDASAKAVAANDAALSREVAPSAELRLASKQIGIKTAGASAQGTLAALTREAIMSTAATWIRDQVPYCQTRLHDGYRMDCSGFVSRAWKLSKPGYTTFNLSDVSSKISSRALHKGDIALNTQRHVMLFAGWSDSSKTVGVWWHSTSSNGTCPMRKGAVVTTRSIANLAANGYHFRTRKQVVAAAQAAPAKPTPPAPAPAPQKPNPEISTPVEPITPQPDTEDVENTP